MQSPGVSMDDLLHVEVAFAVGPGDAWRRRVVVPSGACVDDAVEASGLRQAYPQLDVDSAHVGIFGRRVTLDHPLGPGDRVEVYRDLAIDPMQARRRRAGRG